MADAAARQLQYEYKAVSKNIITNYLKQFLVIIKYNTGQYFLKYFPFLEFQSCVTS